MLWCLPAVIAQDAGAPTCKQCHSDVEKLLTKKVVHPAVEMGCETCHINHREAGEAATKPYLVAEQPDLCFTCHDAADKAMVTAHHNQPLQKVTCTRCHNPHASDEANLLPSKQHGPFSARQCEACHAPAKAGAQADVKLAAETTSEICFQCHSELEQRIKSSTSVHTLLAADPDSCADCHDPHGTENDFYLKEKPLALCRNCHSDIGTGKKNVHAPVAVSCTICHAPHASNVRKQLYVPVNQLCTECHVRKGAEIVQATKPVELFDGRVKLNPKTFDNISLIQLDSDGKTGHPYPGHPVEDAENSRGRVDNCLTCHLPHAANGSRRLFVTEKNDERTLCVKCH